MIHAQVVPPKGTWMSLLDGTRPFFRRPPADSRMVPVARQGPPSGRIQRE
jgi:hypothetical protein